MKQSMPVNDSLPEQGLAGGGIQIPKSPKAPLEFLSRTWSVSALEVSKALSAPPCMMQASKSGSSSCTTSSIPEEVSGEPDELAASLNQFSFASSATSQFVLDRIMSQSVNEISPLTSGRLSHSSGPLIGPGGCLAEDSPPESPSEEFEDVVKYFRSHNTLQPLFTGGRLTNAGNNGCNTPGGARGKTVGRWLKERKEKKKEETRTHNAQLHATVSVAAVASAIAAIAAGTAASSASGRNEQLAKTDMALASAATLVAAQCVEAAEVMGAERGHLASVVSSAVNVRSHDDIATLTAAAATALRGAATLKARALKEVWNAATVIPLDRGAGAGYNAKAEKEHPRNTSYGRATVPEEDRPAVSNEELLARGSELLKRTRQGDLHWKIVSVYLHRSGEVMLKMKSKHVAGTITKKKKNVVLEVCKNMPAWPGRHLIDDGEQRRYFGLRTESRGIVEFECRNQTEYDMWTQGVSRLLFIVATRKNKRLA